ncbi:MAG: hypothetical protein ABFR19_01130 [Pseudomonadota bacterium]
MALFSPRAEEPRDNRQVVSCPAFSSLMQEFSDEQKYRILDLGRARGGTVTYFSRFRCKLFVADVIPDILSYQESLPEDEPPELMLQEMIGLDDLSELDLVLCWDILNYLDAPMIETFSTSLRQLMRNGGHLHAFINTRSEMPAFPGSYQILDAGQMDVEHQAGNRISAPRFAQRNLREMMREFEIKHSRLLQSGMQEYSFYCL